MFIAKLLRRIADWFDPPRRGIPAADRGDTLDWEDDHNWGENPL
jgi:hypothetical protein